MNKGLSRKFEVYYHYLVDNNLLIDFSEWLEHYEKDLLKTKKSLDKLKKGVR